MKKILISVFVLIIIFLIYLSTMDKKVYYLALGDSLVVGEGSDGFKVKGYTDYLKDYLENKNVLEKYVNKFAKGGLRIYDLINDIENNKKIIDDKESITLKNSLVKADLVTLSIGANDLLSKFNNEYLSDADIYNYIDEMTNDLEKLIKIIRQYCKEDIVMIGYYNPFKNLDYDKYISYLNDKYSSLALEYDISYVRIDDIFKEHPEYLPNDDNIHPNEHGYKVIAKEVINKVSKKLFET